MTWSPRSRYIVWMIIRRSEVGPVLQLRLLIVLAVSMFAQPASAQTPAPNVHFTYVSGTALGLLPPGKPGIIDIIPIGPHDTSLVHIPVLGLYGTAGTPVIVWNNTPRSVQGLRVFGMIRTASNNELRAAVTAEVLPDTIPAGEFGFTVVTFADQIADPLASDDVVTFEAFFPEAKPDANRPPESIVPLEVVEVAVDGATVQGTLRGLPPGKQLITTALLCFDAAGQARAMVYDFDALDQTTDSNSVYPFEVAVETPCDRFVVTAQTSFYAPASVG